MLVKLLDIKTANIKLHGEYDTVN